MDTFSRVGIVGIPPLDIVRELNERKIEILDLDTVLVREDLEATASYVPKVYCAILRTVVLNALHVNLDAVYIDVGPGKCDSARYIATVLERFLAVPIIRTENRDMQNAGTSICRSRLSLTDKFLKITDGVKSSAGGIHYEACEPTAGFWGVPPRDFSVLAFFPDTTHIYGWTRCMENKTPADFALEMYCNKNIPTIFFAQSFCAKTALALQLAREHPCALFLDCDVQSGGSAKAKIQAFLELSGVFQ